MVEAMHKMGILLLLLPHRGRRIDSPDRSGIGDHLGLDDSVLLLSRGTAILHLAKL